MCVHSAQLYSSTCLYYSFGDHLLNFEMIGLSVSHSSIRQHSGRWRLGSNHMNKVNLLSMNVPLFHSSFFNSHRMG